MQPDEKTAWKPLLDDARWNNRGNPARAAELTDQAISCAAAEPDLTERARAFEIITEYLVDRERWREASELHGRRMELLRREDPSPDTLARYLARHAEIEASGGNRASAVKLFEEALSLWRAASKEAFWRAATWYEALAELHEADAQHEAVSVVSRRAAELRLEVSGSYYEPRIMRHTRPDGSLEYAFHDVYFTVYGRVTGWTLEARSVRRSSVAELKRWLEDTLPLAENGVICGDLGCVHEATDLTQWLRNVHNRPIDFEQEPAATGEVIDEREGPPSVEGAS